MVKKIFVALAVLPFISFADELPLVTTGESEYVSPMEFKNPKLEEVGPEANSPTAVQPHEVLTFEYESERPEIIQVQVFSKNWSSDEEYGKRTCYVLANVKPQVRHVVPGQKKNRKYQVHVSSDAKECKTWELLKTDH